MIRIVTIPFGAIEVEEEKIIVLEEGIIGFPYATEFILLKEDSIFPLFWFQSLKDERLAFLVINPFLINPDYSPIVDNYIANKLAIVDPNEITLLSILTFHAETGSLTANLMAPLVINARTRKGKQVIYDGADFPLRYEVNAETIAAIGKENNSFSLPPVVDMSPR